MYISIAIFILIVDLILLILIFHIKIILPNWLLELATRNIINRIRRYKHIPLCYIRNGFGDTLHISPFEGTEIYNAGPFVSLVYLEVVTYEFYGCDGIFVLFCIAVEMF